MASRPAADATMDMKVLKRNGRAEAMNFNKILVRLRKIGKDNNLKINFADLSIRIIDQLYDRIPTKKIDELAADHCASMCSVSSDFGQLALHITVSNHHKNTLASFSQVMNELYEYRDYHGDHCPLVAESFIKVVREHAAELDAMCDYSRDYLFSFFGFKTLEKSYLMSINRRIVERPQHMWLRVAVGIHGGDIARVRETYELMSNLKMTHATPTLFNSGTPRPQLSSCFLLAMDEDSIDGIFNVISDCAKISKWSGGIGVAISKIRAKGSMIRGTNGRSNGIVPMLRVFNTTSLYVDQCFHPDTLIYTAHGPARIADCYAGETAVYNIAGEYEVIKQVLEHPYEGQVLRVTSPAFVDDMIVTAEHPIAVFRKPADISWDNHLLCPTLETEWIEAEKLCPDDLIVFRRPRAAAQSPANISAEDAYFYGLMLGAGHISRAESETTLGVFHFYESVPDFVETYLINRGVKYEKQLSKMDGIKRWYNNLYSWSSRILLPFTYADFYDAAGQRRIPQKWLDMPDEYLRAILKGICQSIPCIQDIHYFIVESKSRLFIEGIRYILLRFGILAGGYNYKREPIGPATGVASPPPPAETMYVLRIPRIKEISAIMECSSYQARSNYVYGADGEFILAPVANVETEYYNGILYDLQMTKEHNYMIHNGVVHNGGGKRNGSFAIYLEPWHADVEDFLQLRKNHGDENMKARDLFYALWIPDLFMERVQNNGEWTLMCPSECPGLADCYGDEFRALYEKYESEKRGRKTISARALWMQILDAQMETGTPYLCYKDTANRKSNQKNIGVIKSSNLCSEIMQYSNSAETSVCNLASISLPSCIVAGEGEPPRYDFDELHRIAKVAIRNLNRVIDVNFYPTEATRRSNMRNRPTGLGTQGLYDTFMQMGYSFESAEARKLNKEIFETIYHGALEASMELAQADGPYETFAGSPASQGILQFDMHNYVPEGGRYDWAALKADIQRWGLRNSLLLAQMPTASTSQILNNVESCELLTSNIFSRRTLAGEFIIVNRYLQKELESMKMWNENVKNNIILNNGSVQQLTFLTAEMRAKYKTCWETSMKVLLEMSADRAKFICQSESLNLFVEDPNYTTLTKMHFYGYQLGLKTGQYYLRRRPKAVPQKFSIAPEKAKLTGHIMEDDGAGAGGCTMCSA